jgi:hypothetical protein
MALKKGERIAGAIHDLAHLATLPPTNKHILCVNDQTLYLLQNFAGEEVNYTGRYIKGYYPGGMVDTVDPDDPEVTTIAEIANRFRLEMYPMCEELIVALENINITLARLADRPCCDGGNVGTEFPEDPVTGPPPIGPGEDFPDVAAYDFYKCQQAATIAYSLLQTHRLLLAEFPFGLAGLTIAAMTAALQYVFAAAGLVALFAQLGTITSMISALLQGGTIDFDNVVSRLEALHDDILCALFCANSTEAAITAVSDILDADVPLTPNERTYIKLYLQAVIINRLFSYQPDTLNLVLAPDCSTCGCDSVPCGFIFTDQGLGGGFATGVFRYDGLPFTLASVEADGGAYHRIWFNIVADCVSCPGNWCVEFVSSTLDTATNIYTRTTRCYHCDGETLLSRVKEFQFDTPSAPDDGEILTLGAFYFNNPTPFEVTLRVISSAEECSDAPDLAGEC